MIKRNGELSFVYTYGGGQSFARLVVGYDETDVVVPAPKGHTDEQVMRHLLRVWLQPDDVEEPDDLDEMT